jgi:hypothetical protein
VVVIHDDTMLKALLLSAAKAILPGAKIEDVGRNAFHVLYEDEGAAKSAFHKLQSGLAAYKSRVDVKPRTDVSFVVEGAASRSRVVELAILATECERLGHADLAAQIDRVATETASLKLSPAERKKAEQIVWKGTHPDAKGKGEDGVKRVLTLSPSGGGTESWPLSTFTDDQLVTKMRRVDREQFLKDIGKSAGLRISTETAASLPLHLPAKADEALGQAYNDLHTLKFALDQAHELQEPYLSLYKQVERASDAIALARRDTTQLREKAKRVHA